MLNEGTVGCSINQGEMSSTSIYLMTSSFQSATRVKGWWWGGGGVLIHKSNLEEFLYKSVCFFSFRKKKEMRTAGKTASDVSK